MENLQNSISELYVAKLNGNPKLSSFVHVLSAISRLSGSDRKKAIKAYTDICPKIFSDVKVNIDTSSAYWRLFTKIYRYVLSKEKFEISKEEETLFSGLIKISQLVFAGDMKDRASVDSDKKAYIKELAQNYIRNKSLLCSEVKTTISSLEMVITLR